jgi:hypothetical protein
LGLTTDPGTEWHPHYKDGGLPDLDDAQMADHLRKPEGAEEREAGPFAAEDSLDSPEGWV